MTVARRYSGRQSRVLMASEQGGDSLRYVHTHGSVRSGKSETAIAAMLTYAQNREQHNAYMLISQTMGLLRKNTRPIIDMLTGGAPHWDFPGKTMTLWGKEYLLYSSMTAAAFAAIRGMTLEIAFLDEATLADEDFVDELDARLSPRGARLYSATNPDDPGHWWKTRYIDRDTPDSATFHYELADNPSNTPGYIAALKQSYRGVTYRRKVLGQWVAAEGTIYNIDEVIVEEPPPLAEASGWMIAVDYASKSVTHALLIGRFAESDYIVAEWRHDGAEYGQLTEMQQAEGVISLATALREEPLEIRAYIVDPSSPQLANALTLRQPYAQVVAAVNDVMPGIEQVGAAFARKRLRISPACPWLLSELKAYVWDPNAQRRGLTRPLKANDHAMDAKRYYAATVEPFGGADSVLPQIWRIAA